VPGGAGHRVPEVRRTRHQCYEDSGSKESYIVWVMERQDRWAELVGRGPDKRAAHEAACYTYEHVRQFNEWLNAVTPRR
jgi:hypothetical protein